MVIATAAVDAEPVRVRRRPGWLAPLAATTAVLAIASMVAIGSWSPGAGPKSHVVAGGTPAAPSAAPLHVPVSLTAVVDALAASPPAEAQGRYSFVEIELWADDGDGIAPMREKRWFEDQTRRSYTATYKLPTVDRATFNPTAIGTTDFAAAEFSDALYTVPITSLRPAPGTDPQDMLRQLVAENDGQVSAAGVVSYVAGLFTDGYPSVGTRIAALRLLASTTGVTVVQGADALGRAGLVVSGRSPTGWAATVIIQPSDGVALAASTIFPATGQMSPSSWALIREVTRTSNPPPLLPDATAPATV